MACNFQKHISLDFNCGYARTAVRELTPRGRWKSSTYDTERTKKFRELFDMHQTFGIEQLYFEQTDSKQSQFDQDCESLANME